MPDIKSGKSYIYICNTKPQNDYVQNFVKLTLVGFLTSRAEPLANNDEII